jgi:hypothetical protein
MPSAATKSRPTGMADSSHRVTTSSISQTSSLRRAGVSCSYSIWASLSIIHPSLFFLSFPVEGGPEPLFESIQRAVHPLKRP